MRGHSALDAESSVLTSLPFLSFPNEVRNLFSSSFLARPRNEAKKDGLPIFYGLELRLVSAPKELARLCLAQTCFRLFPSTNLFQS